MSPDPETAVSYAALILADEGLPITADRLQTLLKAANVDVEPIWSTIFAKALEGKNLKEILTSVENSGPAATTGSKDPDVDDDADGDDGLSCGSYHSSDDDSDDEGITGFLLFD